VPPGDYEFELTAGRSGNRNARIARIREWLAETEAGDHPRLGQMRTRLRRIEELDPPAQLALLEDLESILDEIDHRNDIDDLLRWTGKKLHAIQGLHLPYALLAIGGVVGIAVVAANLEEARNGGLHDGEAITMIAALGWAALCAAGFLLVVFLDRASRKQRRQRVFHDELLPEAERRGLDIDDVIRRIEEVVDGDRGTAALRLVASHLSLLLDVLDEEDPSSGPSVS
jgi:hypothetical protein